MSIKINNVKLIGTSERVDRAQEQIDIRNDESLEDYQDKVFLNAQKYKEIFGKSFSKQRRLPWKRGIVKISCTGQPVHRMYLSRNDIRANEMAVTRQTLGLLMESSNQDAMRFTVDKGSRICFYWEHPVHTTRVSFKLGLISVVASVVSLTITLLFMMK